MLKAHSDQICTYFAVEYEPHFGTKLADASERIYAQFKPSQVTASVPLSYVFQWPNERCFLTLDVRRIGWQSLGLAEWSENHKKHVKIMRTALDAIGADKFKRIGFKVSAYLPLEMSHQELCDLMFGSFLVSAEDLDQVLGQPIDPFLQLEGERNGLKYILSLSPMNTQQIANTFRQVKNLQHFLEDRFLDAGVKDFQERITKSDCFFFDIDLFQTDVSADTLDEFVRKSLAESEQVAASCVRRLRSQPDSRKK